MASREEVLSSALSGASSNPLAEEYCMLLVLYTLLGLSPNPLADTRHT